MEPLPTVLFGISLALFAFWRHAVREARFERQQAEYWRERAELLGIDNEILSATINGRSLLRIKESVN